MGWAGCSSLSCACQQLWLFTMFRCDYPCASRRVSHLGFRVFVKTSTPERLGASSVQWKHCAQAFRFVMCSVLSHPAGRAVRSARFIKHVQIFTGRVQVGSRRKTSSGQGSAFRWCLVWRTGAQAVPFINLLSYSLVATHTLQQAVGATCLDQLSS